MAIDESMLNDITATIVQAAKPERVLLIGSHARGDASAHSDLDLMVILPSNGDNRPSRRKLSGQLYRTLAKFPVSKDLLLYTSEEVAHWKDDLNHCIARGLREGKVLYERHEST
jgi:uncharacterized protein